MKYMDEAYVKGLESLSVDDQIRKVRNDMRGGEYVIFLDDMIEMDVALSEWLERNHERIIELSDSGELEGD